MELSVCQVVLQQRSVLMKHLRFRMVFKSVGNKFEQNLIIKVSILRYVMVVYHIFTSIQANLNFIFLILCIYTIQLDLIIPYIKDTHVKIEIAKQIMIVGY